MRLINFIVNHEIRAMATIVHFDISADDVSRACKFYSALFGWEIQALPGPQEYYLIKTTNQKGEPGISGGIAKREKEYQGITNFVQIKSIDASISELEKLGGEIMESKTLIPGVGYIAGCKDTEGNIFGLLEALEE